MNTLQTIEQMRQSPYVKEKELLNGISSFNFTRKAFWDRHWTAATVKARGLFIDTERGRIKARSFDKFFAIGERRETELDILAENFEYPVKAYVKYNGYLGICTGELDEKGGYRLWCASKSTDQGWYAARFEDLLRSALGKGYRMEHFCRTLYENNYTAIFEVIDPMQDPHIIEYKTPQVILLALIMNDDEGMDFYCKTDEVIKFYNATWKLPYKELAYTINNAEELYQWYFDVTAQGYTYKGEFIEGFVLQDIDDHMVKVKTYYYTIWKSFRPVIHKMFKGEEVDYVKWAKNIERQTGMKYNPDNSDLPVFFYWLDKVITAFEEEPSVIEIRYYWELEVASMSLAFKEFFGD